MDGKHKIKVSPADNDTNQLRTPHFNRIFVKLAFFAFLELLNSPKIPVPASKYFKATSLQCTVRYL